MTAWSHLIRFEDSDGIHYGNAIFPKEADATDIVSITESGKLQAQIIESDGQSVSSLSTARVTAKIVPVNKLLSPLVRDQVPIIRCIGLNYMEHSKR